MLISAQTTTANANALYSATALDLARQGVYHVEGGVGGVARTLAAYITASGGEIHYRRRVPRIAVQNNRVAGVFVTVGKRSQKESLIPADFVVANTTPWSLAAMLGESAPRRVRRQVQTTPDTWGAFVLHLGVKDDALPAGIPEHHQVIAGYDQPLGEGRSVFISLSPAADANRAPEGERAVTVSTHTRVAPWRTLLDNDPDAYAQRKQEYADQMIDLVARVIPDIRSALTLTLAGTPVTYEFYTMRAMGMVGGFPQTSLLKARGPRTGIQNLRLVGDSIFPGQSTAGVTLGAMRVAEDVMHALN